MSRSGFGSPPRLSTHSDLRFLLIYLLSRKVTPLKVPGGMVISVLAAAAGGLTAGSIAGCACFTWVWASSHLRTVRCHRVERFDGESNPVPDLHERSGYGVESSTTGRRIDSKLIQ